MKHSESLKNIAPAIRKAQGKIEGAVKDAQNPFFKSRYADLESCWDAIKPALQEQGLSIVQTAGFISGAGPTLITTLLHETGEYISGEQPVCAKGDNPQELGSAITYARRYGLSAIIGLVQMDDDGNAASQPKSKAVPNAQNGTQAGDSGSYVVKLGKKLLGKRLDEIDIYELASFSEYLKGQKRDELGEQTLAAVERYLATRSPKK